MDPTKVYEATDSLIAGMDDTERAGYFDHLRAFYPQELGAEALSGAGAEFAAVESDETPLTAEQLHKKEVLSRVDREDIEGHLKRLGEERRTAAKHPELQSKTDTELPEESDDKAKDENGIIRGYLLHTLGELLYRPRTVIELRFGLDGKNPRTLKEVGSQFGISTTRVRQIQGAAQREIHARIQREAVMIGKES